ncbi:MAG: hypothetical protein HY246_06790 [Proteobacteria bacterium]|nr:hypothetical protein [Pseudomonadota bacterium]
MAKSKERAAQEQNILRRIRAIRAGMDPEELKRMEAAVGVENKGEVKIDHAQATETVRRYLETKQDPGFQKRFRAALRKFGLMKS